MICMDLKTWLEIQSSVYTRSVHLPRFSRVYLVPVGTANAPSVVMGTLIERVPIFRFHQPGRLVHAIILWRLP